MTFATRPRRRLVGGAIVAAAAATLNACASAGGPGGYRDEMAALRSGCDARGGILTPIPGANTGRPATDYACTIHGPATPPPR